MSLNFSNQQIAKELGLCGFDVQALTEQLLCGLAAKTPEVTLKGEVEIDEVYVVAGHKGQPEEVTKGAAWGAVATGQASRDAGTLDKDKPPILGLIQRGSQVVLRMLTNVQQATIKPIIHRRCHPRHPRPHGRV